MAVDRSKAKVGSVRLITATVTSSTALYTGEKNSLQNKVLKIKQSGMGMIR